MTIIKKHKLNNQSFKFPIINPGYIRVKKIPEFIFNAKKGLLIDKRKDLSKPVNIEVEFKIHDSATEELKKFSDRFKKTDYLKKCRDLKKGKKQKEIDFAKLHEQMTGKLFPDSVVDAFQNAFDELQKAIKGFPTFSPIKDIADIDKKVIKSGNYKIAKNRRKSNKKKRYKRRKR